MVFHNVRPKRNSPRRIVGNNAQILSIEQDGNIICNLIDNPDRLIVLENITLRVRSSNHAVNIRQHTNIRTDLMKNKFTRTNSGNQFILRVIHIDGKLAVINLVLTALIYLTPGFCARHPINKGRCTPISIAYRIFHVDTPVIIGCFIVENKLELNTHFITKPLHEGNKQVLCGIISNHNPHSVVGISFNLIQIRLISRPVHRFICTASKRGRSGNSKISFRFELYIFVGNKIGSCSNRLNIHFRSSKNGCHIKKFIVINVFLNNDFQVIAPCAAIQGFRIGITCLCPAAVQTISVQSPCPDKQVTKPL